MMGAYSPQPLEDSPVMAMLMMIVEIMSLLLERIAASEADLRNNFESFLILSLPSELKL